MKATDDNNKPRRYRAEVKRAKIKRGSDRKEPLKTEEASAAGDDIKDIKAGASEAQPSDSPESVEAAGSAETAVQAGPEEQSQEVPGESAEPAGSENQHQAVPVQELPQGDEAEPDSAFDVEKEEEGYVDKTRVMPQEHFEYVVPKETFKQHMRRKHRNREHEGGTKKATAEEMEEAESGFVFVSPRKRRKHRHSRHHHRHRRFRHLRLWQRILIILAAILLTAAIVLGGTFLVLREIGNRSLHNYNNIEVVTPDKDESGEEIIQVDKKGRVITYDGVSYEFNQDLIYVTFIGADEGTGDNADLQMADAIYIMTADTETGKVKILGVSRDTMADIDLYSEQGNYIDTQRMQMAFSYAYGSSEVTGGRNTTTSLERLFYGLPFNDYFAINMKALITLNDTIGGVTLVSSMTFTSPIDGRTISEGETVTLHGKEADYYVRHRDTEKLDSNNDRMRRQQEYIRAFLASLVPAAKKDISVITDLYNAIRVNADTTLGLPKMTYIASTALTKLSSASDIEYISLPGTITEGEYAELNVSNKDAIHTMLDVFYTPLAEVPEGIDQ